MPTSKTPTHLSYFCIFALLTVCSADLPIHCLREQVVGKWTLQISAPQEVTDLIALSCGHEFPDNPENSYLAMRTTFQPSLNFSVTLANDTKVAVDSGSQGSWTMIYDEGMDIAFDNHRFTSFFDYFPDEFGKVTSFCGKTVVGWYTNLESGERACFRAEKVINQTEKAALYSAPVVQMHVAKPPEGVTLLQKSLSSRNAKALRPLEPKPFTFGKGFNDHKSIVDRLNKLSNKHWSAEVPQRFQGKTLEQLNRLAGRKKLSYGNRPTLRNSFIQASNVTDLPKNFTWADKLSPVRNQGDCGSCYVISTMEMLEARLRIKHNVDVMLSPQHVLDCSFHNQGCEGGYPFLAEKFASEFELVPESCSPYLGAKGSCQTCDLTSLSEVYRTENYRFIGGAYGLSNERDMMLEIMNNGPIVASFEPPFDFMYYKNGIYHGVEPDWVKEGHSQPEWERVDHAVLLYGWGETQAGEKYWTLLNSWGPDWGENGTFKMVRGTDECAIESIGEAADPVVVSN